MTFLPESMGALPRRLRCALAALICLGAIAAHGQQDEFVVNDIRIEGLQRITDGAVFNYLPINIGDVMTRSRLQETLRAVYASGFFVDAELRRDDDALVIVVRERPAIAALEIEGNKDIKTEDLEENLRGAGVAPGQSFDRSVLEEISAFLTQEYFDRGKYGAAVETSVEELDDNRVNVKIDIREGARARIRQINIVGNSVFSDDELRGEMTMRLPNLLSFYRKDDRYSREALQGDLETLRSYYMDRGYASFEVTSTQVAISPNKKDVYITINLEEGETYTVSDVTLSGDLVLPEEQLMQLVMVKPGQTFSRKLMEQTNELISFRLGGEGFAEAEVQPIPQIDPEERTVALDLRVVPGARIYVRDIRFNGTKTVNDEVFRREMRQMESAWLSNTMLDRSKQRIQRLPFVEEVDFETLPVAGSDDEVDIEFDVKEGLPGQFGGGLGFSQVFGFTLNGNFTHSNFLGTGDRVALDINAGEFSKVYSLQHSDAYATTDGISRTVGFSYSDTTRFSLASSSFGAEILSATVEYGFPLSEFSRISGGLTFQDSTLEAGQFSSQQSLDWVNLNGDSYGPVPDGASRCVAFGSVVCGTDFLALELFLGWSYDSRDRVIFPRRGLRQRLRLNMTAPGSDVEYYVAEYTFTALRPLWRDFILGWNLELGYGEDLGETTALPPYKNFFAGGPDSVRGFRQARLGPVDSQRRVDGNGNLVLVPGNFYGGNAKLVSQLSLILPTPEKLAASTRFALFWDAGNVFNTDSTVFRDGQGNLVDYGFSRDALRQSVGVAVEWLAPLGTFRFSYASPLNAEDDVIAPDGTFVRRGDQTEQFQFSIGRSF